MPINQSRLHGNLFNHGWALADKRVRPTVAADVADLAGRIRAADVREIAALTRRSPADVLAESVRDSVEPFTITVASGRPAAIMGVVPQAGNPDTGVIWLLGSDELGRVRKSFAAYSPAWVDYLARDFVQVCNVIGSWQTDNIRWLKWLGFQFYDADWLHTTNGEKFYFFNKRQLR